MSLVGITGTVINVLISYIKSRGPIDRHMQTGLAPFVLGGFQAVVLIYVWKQIRRVTEKLKQLKLPAPSESNASKVYGKVAPYTQLEMQMRFWVKVSVFGTLVTMFALGTFAFSKFFSPFTYRVACAVATLGKQINVLAQIMISQPVRSGKAANKTQAPRAGRIVPFASTQQTKTNSKSALT